MKIAMLYTTSTGGGAAVAAEGQKKWFRSKGYQVDTYNLITSKKKFSALFYFNRVVDMIIRKVFFKKNPILHSTNLFSQKLSRKLNRVHYDAVIVHWFSNGLIRYSDFGNVEAPVIMICHDSWLVCGFEHHPFNGVFSNTLFDKYLMTKKKKSLMAVDYFIFPSKWQMRVFQSRVSWPLGKSTVIPNILQLNSSRVTLNDATPNSSYSQDAIVITCIASKLFQNLQKGGNIAYDVLKLLDESAAGVGMPIEFRAIGKESNTSSLPELKNISLIQTGQISNSSVHQNLLSSDVFINLSSLENFSNANIEAQIAGCYLLCRDVGGNSETIASLMNGSLVSDNSKEVCTHLLKIMSDISSIRSLRKERMAIAWREFNPDSIGKKHVVLLESILA